MNKIEPHISSSAGTAAVTKNDALVITDGRYCIAAQSQGEFYFLS